MRYAVTVTKALSYAVQADSPDEASALAITVALGEASRVVQARVRFDGKRVKIMFCEEQPHSQAALTGNPPASAPGPSPAA